MRRGTLDTTPDRLAARNVALVQLMLQARLRVGEVTALTPRDVQLHPRSDTVPVRILCIPLHGVHYRGGWADTSADTAAHADGRTGRVPFLYSTAARTLTIWPSPGIHAQPPGPSGLLTITHARSEAPVDRNFKRHFGRHPGSAPCGAPQSPGGSGAVLLVLRLDTRFCCSSCMFQQPLPCLLLL